MPELSHVRGFAQQSEMRVDRGAVDQLHAEERRFVFEEKDVVDFDDAWVFHQLKFGVLVESRSFLSRIELLERDETTASFVPCAEDRALAPAAQWRDLFEALERAYERLKVSQIGAF